MKNRRILLSGLILFAAAFQWVVLLCSMIPLGVPGEWTWPRIPQGNFSPVMLVISLLVGLGYLLFWNRMERRLARCSRRQVAGLLLILCFIASIAVWSIRGIPQGIYGHSGLTWVTYYPRMSGYFTQASETTVSLADFLAGYEEQVRQGDYLHQGTHPPGLPVYFMLWLKACREIPGLKSFLLATEPLEVAAGTDVLEELAIHSGQSFPDIYRAVLWGNLLLTLLLSTATIFPLFVLLRQFLGREQAWRVCGVWPFLPGLLLFLPKSDLLLPFFAAVVTACFVCGVMTAQRKGRTLNSLGQGLLAGLMLWLSLQISLAMIVTPVILAVWTALLLLLPNRDSAFEEIISGQSSRFQQVIYAFPWLVVSGAILGVVLPCLVVWLVFDLNLLAVWQFNLNNHARFYDHNPRTYWLWLLVNPLELAGSLGMPVAMLLAIAVGRLVYRKKKTDWSPGELFAAAALLVWGLLWVSGKNMGEAGRLWIFLFPLLVAAAGILRQLHKESPAFQGNEDTPATADFPWTIFLLAQMSVCLVSVVAIDAFDFSYFLRSH